MKIISLVACLALACVSVMGHTQTTSPELLGPLPQPLPLFPSTNWWNVDVSQAPVDPGSPQIIDFINNGGQRQLQPDWGPAPYGIPYCTVAGDQPLVNVAFDYADESDPGAPGRLAGYSIPEEAKIQPGWIEGNIAGGGTTGDRHMLIIDRDHRVLFELFALRWNGDSGLWQAGSGAVWPIDSNLRRPDGWTSADAAGLAILPGLVRYDEVYGDQPIKHAFRFTLRASNNYYVFPASHVAGNNTDAPPFGMRMRLKDNIDISGFNPAVKKIFQAMKTYGLIFADNGSDMFITGATDPNWNMEIFVPAFHALHASDFEVIKLGWTAPETGITEEAAIDLP